MPGAACWKCRCWKIPTFSRMEQVTVDTHMHNPVPCTDTLTPALYHHHTPVPWVHPSLGLNYLEIRWLTLQASLLGTPGPSQRVAALGPSLYANAKPQLAPSFLSPLIDCFPSLPGLREPWVGIQKESPPLPGPSNPGSRLF